MDVRCGRCGTEYEFDDALISERGTTVKCTNCGYQFKVFPDAAATAPERWIVRTLGGRELVYTTLRDLQRGIARGEVSANDLLSRGDRAPRPLASIAELEPFLRDAGSTTRRVPRTLHGVAPAANSAKGGDGPPSLDGWSAHSDAAAVHPAGTSTLPISEQRVVTAAPSASGTPAALTQAAAAPAADASAKVAPNSTLPIEPAPAGPAPQQASTTAPSRGPEAPEPPASAAFDKPWPAERVDDRTAQNLEQARALLQHDEQTDPHYTQMPAARQARSRWLVFVVVVAAGGLLAATVGKRYLERYATTTSSPAAEADPKVSELLAEGQRLLAKGELEAAKEALSKATALSEKDPGVLTSLAQLHVLEADVVWLKLKLLDPDDKLAIERAEQELASRSARAARAVAKVSTVAPGEPSTQRLNINLQRISGKTDQARSQVGAISRDANLAENAYALAALDMAEQSPVWSSIIHRLRSAAVSEGGIGQARAALVYALTRAGQTSAAQTELEKLAKLEPTSPLVFDLKAYVNRHAEETGEPGPETDQATEAIAPDRTASDSNERSTDETPRGGDFRVQLKQAYSALGRRDLDKAERLYRSVLDRHPGNTEALAGLAEVANQRNDRTRANELYAQVLEKNPSYLPALMANADQKWASGDKQGALKLYRRILDQAGAQSSYGQRAAARIAQANSEAMADEAPSQSAAKPPTEGSQEPEAAPDKPDVEEPHIDTTDLPELNQ